MHILQVTGAARDANSDETMTGKSVLARLDRVVDDFSVARAIFTRN